MVHVLGPAVQHHVLAGEVAITVPKQSDPGRLFQVGGGRRAVDRRGTAWHRSGAPAQRLKPGGGRPLHRLVHRELFQVGWWRVPAPETQVCKRYAEMRCGANKFAIVGVSGTRSSEPRSCSKSSPGTTPRPPTSSAAFEAWAVDVAARGRTIRVELGTQ